MIKTVALVLFFRAKKMKHLHVSFLALFLKLVFYCYTFSG